MSSTARKPSKSLVTEVIRRSPALDAHHQPLMRFWKIVLYFVSSSEVSPRKTCARDRVAWSGKMSGFFATAGSWATRISLVPLTGEM